MVKRATVADVADLARVSKTAVSLVLNNRPNTRISREAADRVRAAAEQLNYRPDPAARSLRMAKTSTVGFISNDVTITRYASAMIRGALDLAHQQEHTVLIAETGEDPRQVTAALEAMIDRRADGIVFGSMTAKQLDLPTLPAQLPAVTLNAISPSIGTAVLPSEREAGYRVTRLMLDHGHRRIGVIGTPIHDLSDVRISATIGERFAGIRQAFAEHDLEPVISVDEDLWEPHQGYLAATRLVDSGAEVSALICLNDRLAFGTYQVLQERGIRIPEQMSIVSFDDDELASYLRPGLTTARIPYEDMGRTAMDLLLDGSADPQVHLVPMPIQLRESMIRVPTPARRRVSARRR